MGKSEGLERHGIPFPTGSCGPGAADECGEEMISRIPLERCPHFSRW